MEITSKKAIVVDIPKWENGFFFVIRVEDKIFYLNSRDVECGADKGSLGFFEDTGTRKYFFLNSPCLGKVKTNKKIRDFRKVIVN